MQDAELRPRRIAAALLIAAAVIALAIGTAFALLHEWRLPPGGESGSAALLSDIPEPRLQTAPQLDRSPSPNATPDVEQRLGAQLARPPQMLDDTGRRVDWRAWAADRRPLVLLPAYYRCDTLCGTVAHGALEALADTGLPPSAWRLAFLSIDPRDTPQEASALRHVYLQYARFARPAAYAGASPELHLLSGNADDTAAVAHSIGFHWTAEPGDALSFAHPTGLVVLTADGTVSRYLFGVRFDPRMLRAAIVEASRGEVGTFTDRLLLACSHFDPSQGLHDGAVMALTRGVALLIPAALAVWIWRRQRRRPR